MEVRQIKATTTHRKHKLEERIIFLMPASFDSSQPEISYSRKNKHCFLPNKQVAPEYNQKDRIWWSLVVSNTTIPKLKLSVASPKPHIAIFIFWKLYLKIQK